MEGKMVMLSILIMSLVMAQMQVGAAQKACCTSTWEKFKYATCCGACALSGKACLAACLRATECMIINDENCPEGYSSGSLENSGDAATEYCKLGCASSVCGPIITLQKPGASEIVNGAVEKCTKTCSTLCTKGSTTAL